MSERHRDCDLVVVSRRCLSQRETAPRSRGATRPPMPPPSRPPGARVVCSLRPPLSRPSCTLAGPPSSPPLLPLYCYRFSASPSRSKRLEVRRREGGRQGGRAGNELAASGLVSLSPSTRSSHQESRASVSPPQCLPKPKNGRRLRSWGRGEESSQQREESIVTWLSRLSLHPSLPCHSFPSIRASSDREGGKERGCALH